MRRKLSNLSLKAYLSGKRFLQDFKSDERGLSGIVVTVLLILVAVLAIVMFWGSLKALLTELWGKVIGDKGTVGITGGDKLQ